jgi:hypothetical protein
MNIEHLQSIIRTSDKTELVRRLAADLDRPSLLIGAEGPPDQPGPEEPYIRALADPANSDLARPFADALHVLLLEEAGQIAKTGQVQRPLLLYNVFSLLEALRLPGVEELLQILRRYEQPLAVALTDQHDDLYAQLLLAHAVNQHGSAEDLKFWLGLLDHENVDYVNAGVVGLRESGACNALRYLERVKEAHRRHPELGAFGDEVMLLLDTYPDFNWALQAGEYVLDEETKALIQSHDRDRYRPDVDELTGPVAEAIRRAGKTDQVRKSRGNWLGPTPALALLGTATA